MTFIVGAEIKGDASKFVAASREAKAAFDNLGAGAANATEKGRALEKSSLDLAKAEELLARIAVATEGSLSALTAQLARTATTATSTAAATDTLAKSEQDAATATRQMATETTRSAEALQRAHQETANSVPVIQSATVVHQRHRAEIAAVGAAAGLTKNQLQTLKYTLSDIVASSASGINPMTMLMQQGPQVLQAFDSPMAALRGLGGLLTSTAGLVATGAAVAVTGVMAYESYAASIREVSIALLTNEDRLGASGNAYLRHASQIAEAADLSEREGRQVVGAMIAAGVASEEAMADAAAAARGFAVATGQSAGDAAVELAGKMKDPAKAARELAEQFNLLDEKTLRQIESSQRSGDMLGAQKTLAEALEGKFAGLADETSGWARAFEDLANWASNAWDASGKFLFGGGGATDALSQDETEVMGLRAKLTLAEKRKRLSDTFAPLAPDDYQALLSEIEGLQGSLKLAEAELEVTRGLKERSDAQDRRRAQSREVGRLDDRYNPDDAKFRRFDQDEAAAKLVRDDPKATADDRARAETVINGIIRERQDLNDAIAKRGETDADKEAERAAKRAAAEQQRLDDRQAAQMADLALVEQIFAARERGDEAAVRALEAQREAAKKGFDLTTAQGQAYATAAERANDLEAAMKAMDDVQGRMGSLDARFTPGANGLRLSAELEDVQRWHDGIVAAYNKAGNAKQDYADLELVTRDAIARIYDEDLRRRTDWAAGVERTLRDLQHEATDFAAVAEDGLRDIAQAGEQWFMDLATKGEMSFDRLLESFLNMAAKMEFQQLIQPGLNSLLGMAASGLGSLLGVESGPLSNGWGHEGHTGMIAGVSGGRMRSLPLSVWAGAPRYHDGGLVADEVPAILKRNEGVFTPQQMDNADGLFRALAGRPNVVVNLIGAPDGTKVSQRDDGQGGLTMDILLDQVEDRIAGNISQGRSPIGGSIEQAYGLGRAV